MSNHASAREWRNRWARQHSCAHRASDVSAPPRLDAEGREVIPCSCRECGASFTVTLS